MPVFPDHIYLLKQKLLTKGGLEKYSKLLFTAFKSEGKKVEWVTQKTTENTCAKFLPAKASSFFNYQKIRDFDKQAKALFLKEGKNKLFFGLDRTSYQHVYRAGNGVHAAYLQERLKKASSFQKYSLTFNPLHQSLLEIEKTTFEFSDLQVLFTNSHMVKKQILEFYKLPSEKIQVVHNGVAYRESEAYFEANNIPFKKRLGYSEETVLWLFVGNGWERKGLRELIDALAIVRHKKRSFHLLVIGKEKCPTRYQKLASERKVSQYITFIGPVKDTSLYYQAADALIIPSHYDPFANVTLEALAWGCYVLSSKSNGGHEIINPLRGIVLENIFCPQNFANHLIQALENPSTPEIRTSIRKSVKDFDYAIKLKELLTRSLSISL